MTGALKFWNGTDWVETGGGGGGLPEVWSGEEPPDPREGHVLWIDPTLNQGGGGGGGGGQGLIVKEVAASGPFATLALDAGTLSVVGDPTGYASLPLGPGQVGLYAATSGEIVVSSGGGQTIVRNGVSFSPVTISPGSFMIFTWVGNGRWLITTDNDLMRGLPLGGTDGQVLAKSGPYDQQAKWLDLRSAWIPFPFSTTNTWTDGAAGRGNCFYCKDAMGFVHFRGSAAKTTGSIANGEVVGTLPAGFYSDSYQTFQIPTQGSAGSVLMRVSIVGSNVPASQGNMIIGGEGLGGTTNNIPVTTLGTITWMSMDAIPPFWVGP